MICCLLILLGVTTSFVHDMHPVLNSIHSDLPKSFVRFGSLEVDVENDLFDEAGKPLLHHHHRQLGSLVHETLRSRLIYLPDLRPRVEEGEVIEFELFDGMVVIAKTDRIHVYGDDAVSWNGDVRIATGNMEQDLSLSDGYFGLSCFKKSCAANIMVYSTNQEFNIAPSGIPLEEDGDGVYSVSEIYLDSAKRTGVTSQHVMHASSTTGGGSHVRGSLRGSDKGSESTISTEALIAKDTDHIIDIIVLYTPQAVSSYAGGR